MLTCLLIAAMLPLNGLWDFRLEEGRPMEKVSLPSFVPDSKMVVPGAWDAMSGYYNRRGTGCYRRTFTVDGEMRSPQLVVDGLGLRGRFWLDGRELGLVKLPWSRVELDLGDRLEPGTHELVAAIDSTVDAQLVKLFCDTCDFYPFGGFHHGVWIEYTRQATDFRRVVVRTRDYRTGLVELQLEPWPHLGRGCLDGELTVVFDNGRPAAVTFKDGKALVKVPNFKLWSPEEPNLHTVQVICRTSQRAIPLAEARFGVRQVGTAHGRITLNGKPVYLKGVNRHEAHFEFGATTPKQLMYEDIRNLKDLGGNFIRGSHYAQCEEFLDLCDEMGVLVWEESLGWGNTPEQLADSEFCDLQEEETRLMVRNSINHPSVIITGFLNEPVSGSEVCKALVDRLIAAVRAEDTGHLVTFACSHTENDISHANTDIIAYNTYPCWYNDPLKTGSADEMRRNIRACHRRIVKYFRDKYMDDRPIIVSETGVKADYGARDPRGRAQYTEDFQAEYTRDTLEEIFANREIAGVVLWQLTDSKTYTRTEGLRNRSYGVNTGGLYDLYRRPKLAVEVVRQLFRGKVGEDEVPLAAFPKWSAPRAVTQGPHEHFLASYFAIDSWSPNRRHLLVLETDVNGRLPEPGERCSLGVVDLEDGNKFIPVTSTACWNFQEAAMAYWMNDNEIIFNDVRDGKFKAVVMNWRTKKDVRVLPLPVSAVSEDRTWAVSVNYARLFLLRPDYGYAGPGQDARETVPWPEDDGLWTMDLRTGKSKLILSVAATRSLQPEPKKVAGKPGQPLAYHCHTAISKDGAKIFFLSRSVDWFNKETHEAPYWNTTAFTVDRDGTNLRRCFKDGWACSHFNWAPDGSHRMLAMATWNATNDPSKTGRAWSTVEFEVGKEDEVRHIGKGVLDVDWHCVYSPDGKFMSGETYWNKYDERPWVLVRLADGMTMPMGSFYVPEKYRGIYWRCDLHARFRPDGRQIAFNSVHEGSRQVYVRDIEGR